LRRGGSVARQALLIRVGQVGRRRSDSRRTGPVVYTAPESPVVQAPQLVAAPPAVPAAVEAAPVDDSLLPGEHTTRRRVCFAVVNLCTLASVGLGMTAILLAMHGDVRLAATFLIGCVGFDGIDGALARKLGVSSPFGAQMDSMADMCSFGLAAPVVVYASISHSVPSVAAAIACVLVAACAAVRLARFNVSPKDGRFFTGVPTTMAAAVLALAVLIGLPIPGWALLGGVAVLAVAMVSSFPYAKIAKVVKLPPWLWLMPIFTALIDPRLSFVVVVAGYLASGPFLWLKGKRRVELS
jgi:CDP-diacylglycerol--serine O-phosphatidyltransferase